LLSDLGRKEFAMDAPQYAGVAWRLVNSWLHELLNYNTFIWGIIQGGEKDRIVGPEVCRYEISGWLDRLPYKLRSLIGAALGRRFYCQRYTWWGGLRRDGSVDADFRGDENASASVNPVLVQNMNLLSDTERGLNAGDEIEVARYMRAI